MEPTTKHEKLEDFLIELTGSDRRLTIEANKCRPAPIGCGEDVERFRDTLSEREYQISGLCQACQDKVFG